jgi:hypothetical protein
MNSFQCELGGNFEPGQLSGQYLGFMTVVLKKIEELVFLMYINHGSQPFENLKIK